MLGFHRQLFLPLLLLAACSGQTSSSHPDPDGGGKDPACPAGEPVHGTPCTGDLNCFYGRHGDCPDLQGGVEFHDVCVDGLWTQSTEGSCDSSAPACPADEPVLGTPCTGDLNCFYGRHGDCTAAPGGVEFHDFCIDGVWTQLTVGSCDSPSEGPCDPVGTWTISYGSDAESTTMSVAVDSAADTGYTVKFVGLEPDIDPCTSAPDGGPAYGSLSTVAQFDASTCRFVASWFKATMNRSCFEGNCEETTFDLVIQNDSAQGTATHEFEYCGHGGAQLTTRQVSASRVP